jgi:predicted ArsR family transcriptional regulator
MAGTNDRSHRPTHQRLRVLVDAIAQAEPLTAAQLASQLAWSRAAVGRTLREAERLGVLRRRREAQSDSGRPPDLWRLA